MSSFIEKENWGHQRGLRKTRRLRLLFFQVLFVQISGNRYEKLKSRDREGIRTQQTFYD